MAPAIETLNDLAAAWAGSLLRASWQGGLAIAAAWLLVRCHRGLPPRVACWGWRLADLKLVVAMFWAAPLLLPLLPPVAPPTRAPVRAPDPVAIAAPPIPLVEADPIAEPDAEPVEARAFPRPGPASIAMLAWLAGAVAATAMAGRSWLAVRRLRRSCPPVDRRELTEIAAGLAAALGLRRIPELRAGPGVARPMLVGAIRPAILLPSAMLDGPISAEATRAVLAHEMAHVRRRDLWWDGLSRLAGAIGWFHPMVWLAHREARHAREAASDAMAIGAVGVRPSEYGRILLDIAASGPGRARGPVAAALGMAGPAGSLRRRLIAMKTIRRPSRSHLLSWAVALSAVGAAGIVPWRLVHREAIGQEPAPPADRPAAGAAGRGTDEENRARLKLAEARLASARLLLKAREADVEKAESDARAQAARLEYRRKQRARIADLVERRAVEERLLDEEDDRLRVAEADDRRTKLQIAVARAGRDAGEAAVREAEALRDLSRAGSRVSADVEAEDALAAARQQQIAAEHRLARATAGATRAELDRAYCEKQFRRIAELGSRGAVEQRLVDGERDLLETARQEEAAANSAVAAARAELDRAEAAIREAEARQDLARVGAQPAADPGAAKEPEALKDARARLNRARVDRARAEREAARAEVDRAEADAGAARANVAYRTRQWERIKQLVDRGAIEPRLVDEEAQRLAEARNAATGVEAAVRSARARLKAAEAHFEAIQAEPGIGGSGSEGKPPAPLRR